MDTIQTDVSDQALITAIRANLCDVFRHMSRSDPVNHFENERFVRWYTSLEHPWFNGVLCTDLPTDGDESFIDETIKYFHKKQVAVFTWWLEPHLKRSDWESVLSKYGFGFSDDTPGMAIVLSELNESIAKIQGLEIRVVEDENAMHTWVNIFVKGYGLPLDWEDQIFQTWMKLGFEFPMQNYLGYLNGEPVSTSCLFLGGGAAGIYNVATLPEARGKGIGAALTLIPLLEARRMEYRVGVLQSSEMGYSVYNKLGFKHLCQIENFYLAR